MGVHGLWQLLNSAGRPVTLESLEGKVLAVDVSLWLHQTMKGMRDKDGNPLPNAHLQGLFSRICKLLFYRIKPVFVFDGDTPALKKQTLIARRERKAQAERESKDIAQKLLQNLVKSEAVKNALADGSSAPVRAPWKRRMNDREDRDIFELAPLNDTEEMRLKKNAEDWDLEFEQQENWIREGLAVLVDVKRDSEEFKSMPMEIQHEALNDMKERQKYHSLRQMTQMPEDSDSFSAYQLKKLMKQCNLTTEIDSVRKRMANKTANDLQLETETDYTGDKVEARRIVSEDASHYILVKGMSKEKQKEQADRYALESKVKEEKEDAGYDAATMSEQKSQSAGKRQSSSSIREGVSGSKKARISGPGGKRKENNDKKRVFPVVGTSMLLDRLSSQSDDDDDDDDEKPSKEDDVESESDGIEEMSSEDEGFIEVAFDPAQVVEEDELFPASIFSNVPEDEKEESDPSTEGISHTYSMNNPQTSVIEDEDRNRDKQCSNGNKVKDNDGEEKDGINDPKSDAEKRKNVLNDILSQLKKKKEEIEEKDGLEGIEDDDEINTLKSHEITPSTVEDVGQKTHHEKRLAVADIPSRNLRRSLSSNASSKEEIESESDVENASKVHHIDSDQEDEDLKLAIQLSMETTQVHRKDTVNESTQNDGDEDDNEDFELVKPLSDHNITEHDFSEEDVEGESNESDGGEESQDQGASQNYAAITNSAGGPEERLQPEDFEIDMLVSDPNQYLIEDVTGDLEAERIALLQERGKQARLAASVTEQVTLEAQGLLELFGIPYIVSPMEAEAQCAFLDLSEQTQGTITDDSDIWLFGGRRMYKNFFNQNKHVEFFSKDAILSQFGLSRQQLINVALLCGSDYTEGIEGVGPVKALEIMGEFPGDDLDGLREFRKWWDKARKSHMIKETNKLRARLRDLGVIKGFPSQAVVDAYLRPAVDESEESFTWGQPDLDLLRQFAKLKFGWSREKSDRTLEPMMKRLTSGQTQGRIYSYFQPQAIIPAKVVKSSRLVKALSRVQGGSQSQAERKEEIKQKRKEGTGSKKEADRKGAKDKAARERDEEVDRESKIVKVGMKKKRKDKLKVNVNNKLVDGSDRNEIENKEEMLGLFPLKIKEEEDIAAPVRTNSASNLLRTEGAKTTFENPDKGKKKSKVTGGSAPTRERQKVANLTLETKRKPKRGSKASTKKTPSIRSSVCLSESSSDSESDDIEMPNVKEMASKSVKLAKISHQGIERDAIKSKGNVTKAEKITPSVEELPVKSMRTLSSASKVEVKVKGGQAIRDNSRSDNSKPTPHDLGKRKRGTEQDIDKVRVHDDSSSSSKRKGTISMETCSQETSQSLLKGKRDNLSSSAGRTLSSEDGDQSGDKEDGINKGLPKQQVVKNPDVSLINAETLKSTLIYLNKTGVSHEKKQLLHDLKGGHRPNAVEMRMEEEEKRERMMALMNRRKEDKTKTKTKRKDTDTQEDSTEPKQLISFEEMLGGIDAEKSVKDCASKTKSKPGTYGNSKSQKMKSEIDHGRAKQPESSGRILPRTSTAAKPEAPQKRRMRMRSMSNDDDDAIDYITKLEEAERDNDKDHHAEVSAKDQRSTRSRCFDQPIKGPTREPTMKGSDGGGSQSDKFQYQLEHVHDSRSVKAHAYGPKSRPLERGLAIAGKGKGVGKNRNGRKGDKAVGLLKRQEEEHPPVAAIQASKGVTATQIEEYAVITAEDLGSDFSDSEF